MKKLLTRAAITITLAITALLAMPGVSEVAEASSSWPPRG